MTNPSLTIDPPASPVRATVGPCEADAVVLELSRAMRGSVHVTASTHPQSLGPAHRRTRLGPVNAFKTTAPEGCPPAARAQPHQLPGQPDSLPRLHRPPQADAPPGPRTPRPPRREMF